jgi:putative tricarboxylic transport membrane protein
MRRINSSIALGLAIAALGMLMLLGLRDLAAPEGVAVAGPDVFPKLTGSGLTLLGLALVLRSYRERPAGTRLDPMADAGLDWRGVGFVLGGIFAFVTLLRPAGMIIGGVVLFACVSAGFRSRAPFKDSAVGLCLSLAVYLLFTRLLGLQIPVGAIVDAVPW